MLCSCALQQPVGPAGFGFSGVPASCGFSGVPAGVMCEWPSFNRGFNRGGHFWRRAISVKGSG